MIDPVLTRRATIFLTLLSDNGDHGNCVFRVGDMPSCISSSNLTKRDVLFLLESLKFILDLDLADEAARDLENNPPEF
jgi:hypothetical protein